VDPQNYLAAIKVKVASSPIVVRIHVVQEYATLTQGFFRARLTLRNDEFLEVSEFFQVGQEQIQTIEYRYQWMDAERHTLIKRWDNARHHPHLPNFPHHIHIGETGILSQVKL
jgi:RNase adaptor protein for sRNA GlmZ degradation